MRVTECTDTPEQALVKNLERACYRMEREKTLLRRVLRQIQMLAQKQTAGNTQADYPLGKIIDMASVALNRTDGRKRRKVS